MQDYHRSGHTDDDGARSAIHMIRIANAVERAMKTKTTTIARMRRRRSGHCQSHTKDSEH
jgi:hypothetical protein